MLTAHTIFGILFLISILLVLVGSWMLHRRVHNLHSLVMLLSLIGLSLWIPFSTYVVFWFLRTADATPSPDTNVWLYIATGLPVPSLLFLSAAVSFVLCVRSIERPNNSFKPKPLRGSA